MGLHDPRRRQGRRDLGVVVHRCAEGILVAVGRPDLVHLVGMLGNRCIVEDEHAQRLRVHRRSVLLHHRLSRVKQQLQRRQPLLAIDHMSHGDEARRDPLLIEDDRPEEVRGDRQAAVRVGGGFHQLLGQRADVLPERVPLVFLGPHVRPLEERYDIADVEAEETSGGQRLCLHSAGE
jgi:hypothetical protein